MERYKISIVRWDCVCIPLVPTGLWKPIMRNWPRWIRFSLGKLTWRETPGVFPSHRELLSGYIYPGLGFAGVTEG